MHLEVTKVTDLGVMMNGKHILIVDDYPDAVEIWALCLRSLGYQVSTASDGAEAIEEAERLLPDLIVLDLELPRVSGFDVARHLRAHAETESIPLIAATGYSHQRQLDLARDAGFDLIVIKPCQPDELVHEIERLLHADATIPSQPNPSNVQHGHNIG
jgi:CheY-like chemotaxis protein